MEIFSFGKVFKDREERTTVFIAFLLLLFFAWLIYYLGFFNGQLEDTSSKVISKQTTEKVAPDLPSVVLGTVEVKKEATQSLVDQDGDGINDENDICPQTTGLQENRGCRVIEIEEN